ncbi:MAG: Wzz/FepE/Etk N-terminal domain-containing protein [Ruminococcus sp.]|nr:Wzz/FepE/Etk N-terminal domain-containing protein [Ruminococcus sp.]
MPKDLTPQKIIGMLLRHVKLIFLIAALVTLISYGYSSFFITPVYSTSSLILIHSYNDSVVTKSTTYYNNSVNGNGRVAVSEISLSSTLAGHCVILFSNMPDMTSLMSGASVSFEQVDESPFIRISATSSNPQVAANVCNQLAEQAPKCFQDEYGKGNGKVTIITSAAAPSSPISPNVNQNTLYGLAIGAVLGVLLAFFLEIIDTTLKPGDDLAKLYGVPVFAEIVDFEKEG